MVWGLGVEGVKASSDVPGHPGGREVRVEHLRNKGLRV